jgi:hypothetical protein
MDKERYEELDSAYQSAIHVCSPDIYQYKHNMLTEKMAEFMLKPYWDIINSWKNGLNNMQE